MSNLDILINSVTAGHRPNWPGVGSWATFLIALLFTGICGAVWVNNEAMAVWLLSEGAVRESSSRALPGAIRSWAIWSGITGLIGAQLVLLWGVFGVTPWAPVQALVPPAWKAVRLGSSSFGAFAQATFIVARGVLAEGLRPLGSALAATVQAAGRALGYTWQVTSTPVMFGCSRLVLGLGYLKRWGVAFGRKAVRALGTALYFTWLAVFTPVAISGMRIMLGLRYLGTGASTVLRYLVGILAVTLYHTSPAVSVPFAAIGIGLMLGMRYLGAGASTVLRYLGSGLAEALHYSSRAAATLVAATSTGLGYLRAGATTVLGYSGGFLATAYVNSGW